MCAGVPTTGDNTDSVQLYAARPWFRDRPEAFGRPCTAPVAVHREHVMSLGTILLVVVILLLIGVLPTWPHARSWGYGPSGVAGIVLVILIVLFLMGRL